jgi:hypothetical protein
MSHFYGVLQGQAGEATRRGSRNSGLQVAAASWRGAIRVSLWHDEKTGEDRYRIEQTPWHGRGKSRLIAEGLIED